MRGFLPKHNNCTKEITSVIKLMYDEAWPNWKAIPAATRARMFDKWAKNFTWDKKHDELIKAIFNTRASKRFSEMMEDATDKRNRASEKCVIYTGGSATPMQTKAKMTKSLDRPVSMAEVFKQTHTLKVNKEQFTDKRSSDIWDDFTNNTTVATQQAAKSGTNATVDPDQVWRQTVSEPSEKNRVFGIGGFLASTLRTFVFAPHAFSVSLTSPAPAGQEKAVDLREQEHRRQMQEHRRQMGVTGEQMHAGSSSAAQVPPLHPPAPPEDDDDDNVDP
ncbi:hypothetical protein PIB30_054503 [Stylosanthes scabra]|uniref:Uncharacterized protein n=1 Tax=Stylosanthes scabra TaxID=79078 RepID=A0ABU6TJD0_9FABA|nr:hypothetical protein [Stylosanthes scabra]